ncbi:MAG TPA: hypothetical protein VFM28_06150 [Nitrososphaeraceae archaeon]|nr:hypothetical protein [Nitrososphaeraceae archaeon]
MINDDLLTSIRTRLTQIREDLTKYENIWREYNRREPNVFKNDIEYSFKGLIDNFKLLLWEVELFCIRHEILKEEVNILKKFLYQSPHIANNTTLKNQFDNELMDLEKRLNVEYRSFLKHLEREELK